MKEYKLNVLTIDASGRNSSISIVNIIDNVSKCKVISNDLSEGKQQKSLSLMLEELFSKIQKPPLGLIQLIAVTIGPGSFTKIRSSIAVAKGLSVALKIPCIGVNVMDKLDKLISNDPDPKSGVLSICDTHRGSVFIRLKKLDTDHKIKTDIKVMPISKIIELKELKCLKTIHVIGDFADLVSNQLKNNGYDSNLTINKKDIFGKIGATVLADLAIKEMSQGLNVNLKPLYLSEPLVNIKR